MARIAGMVMCLILSFLINNTWAAKNELGAKIKWGYDGELGPLKWASLDTGFALCEKGQRQSPIDLLTLKPGSSNDLTVNYRDGKMGIVDDGLTHIRLGNDVVIFNSGHGLQLNFTPNQEDVAAFDLGYEAGHTAGYADLPATTQQEKVLTVKAHQEYVTYKGEDYALVQFHFHTPAENTYHNTVYPMEIHFVHQGKGGHVLVVGVWVKEGASNKILRRILENLPKDEGVVHPLPSLIDPSGLLPARKDYYQFAGSLTTPPCLEGVTWIMLSNTITASKEQIAKVLGIEGKNARPVQALNKRDITYSLEKTT